MHNSKQCTILKKYYDFFFKCKNELEYNPDSFDMKIDRSYVLPPKEKDLPLCCGCIEKFKNDPHNEIMKF